MVSRCPLLIPKVSLITFKIGVIALVVQDAAEKISTCFGLCSLWFTPYTILGIPFPGAVRSTLETPLAER